MNENKFTLQYDANTKEEIEFKATNKVGDLVELPEKVSVVGCKQIYKTKRDSSGNIEQYKTRFVANNFTQTEGIEYYEMLSLV